MSSPVDYARNADGYMPIEAYGAIGNGRTVALVSSDGSVDWCPFPRIDSPSVFARVLDADRGGYWQIIPEDPAQVSRCYLDDTNILSTTFTTESGAVELIDLMPSIAFGSDLGKSQRLWDGALLRFVRGVQGTVRMRMVICPRFNYGRETATYEIIPGKGALLCGKSGALRVATTIPLNGHGDQMAASFEIAEGDADYIGVSFHGTGAAVWTDLTHDDALDLLNREVEGWKRWISRCSYHGPYEHHVRRSALMLKLLDYLPTGAMVAAPTTSLPESIGNPRNWDYRFSWIRDTSYALHAFYSIGYRDEAESFLQWVIDVTNDRPSSLQIMYRVDGRQDLDEIVLDHLEGYRKSWPVRIGNGAHDQRQLDRFGEVIDAAWVHRRFGGVINGALWEYIVQLTDVVKQRWRLPDSGIWEVRSGPKRMTYSNVMCWVAFDRAIRIAEMDHRDAPLDDWRAVRDEIRAEIMQQGVSKEGYFTQGFGDDILDSSALSFPLRSFIDVDDPVMKTTIEAIQRDLTANGLVWRYRSHDQSENSDGLPGREGSFILCTCWLIDCLVGLRELDAAQDLLEGLLARANDLGLYAEEIDGSSGQFLGNFPQAFSHLGIINAIVNLGRAYGDVAQPPDLGDADITGAIPGGPETRHLQDKSGG
jgi:GH15 family glucan-1,4-alpha-glucosidase